MIIGIDIDGTITAAPERFALLCRALRLAGHTVLVVTADIDRHPGHDYAGRQEQLRQLGLRRGVHYDQILIAEASDRAAVAHMKAQLCEQWHVDVMVDNDPLNCAAIAATGTTTLKVCP